jgi:carboxyl-terminal processing protease
MKFRTGLLVAGSFVIGIGVGVVAPSMNDASARGATGSDVYQQLNLFSKVFDLVRTDYVFKEPAHKIIYHALDGMLSGLDPHSSYMNTEQYQNMQAETNGQFGGLGIEVSENGGMIRVVSPIDGTPAAKAGIKAGDIIVAINGKPTIGLTLDKAVDKMRGPVGSKIHLTLKRPGDAKAVKVTITRAVIHVDPVKDHLYGNVGYVRLSTFSENASDDLKKALRRLKHEDHGKLRAYVLDLRNNPGGLLNQGIAVADDFLNSGEIVSTHGRHKTDDEVWYAHHGDMIDGKPLIVMVNSGTASAAEIVTAALQQNRRAAVLGVRSFGKGSVQTIFPIQNHGAVRMTTALYYTPSGKSIQDYGVEPDVKVRETRGKSEQFPLVREFDMPNAIHNPSGLKAPILPPPIKLPAAAKTIAPQPPANWPKFERDKASTDYQLQMALKLARAMAEEGPGANGGRQATAQQHQSGSSN